MVVCSLRGVIDQNTERGNVSEHNAINITGGVARAIAYFQSCIAQLEKQKPETLDLNIELVPFKAPKPTIREIIVRYGDGKDLSFNFPLPVDLDGQYEEEIRKYIRLLFVTGAAYLEKIYSSVSRALFWDVKS